MYISQDPIKLAGGNNLYSYVHNPHYFIDLSVLYIGDDKGMDFDTWFDQASKADIEANMKDVTSKGGLRNGGGKHEIFPVSMAPKAKGLGFSAKKLKDMSVETSRITFVDVVDPKTGTIIDSGKHHSSRASWHFHDQLMDDLDGAKTKAEAKKIIADRHKTHMRLDCP